jgi:glycosyltransferase involved in cell wall biosynthesis
MNILLGVYACEPHKGSEPEVGWQMVNEIAKAMPNDTIYAITKYNNQILIEQEKYPENVKFFYYQPPKWLTFWKKGGRGIRTYYYVWMLSATVFMKKQKIYFDIVHHVTFVNDWLPSFFFLLKKKKNKFIWGPIGSHAPIDNKFLDGTKRKTVEKIRIFLQLFFRNLDPSFHICKSKADCIIGITESVKENLHLSDKKNFIAESAIAMKESTVKSLTISSICNKKSFTVISVGRLLYIKNFKLTILAFSKFLNKNPKIKNATLRIIGEGGDKTSLQNYAKELGIDKSVEFLGQMSREKVQEHFSEASVFLFPTLESAGFVTLEAMSYALPVVAMDYGGPKQFIKQNKDKQLVDSTLLYNDIANSLAKKLETFYYDKKLANIVGEENRKEILKHFTWESKAQKMCRLYKELLNET